MNMRKLFAALFAASLLLGACGSDGGDDDDASSDTTEEDSGSDTTEASDDSDSDSDDSDADAGAMGDCAAASGAVLTLGFMPLAFAFSGMGEAFTDDTLFAESDIEEMQTAIDDLKDAVPSELEEDVNTLSEMSADAFDDPESFDETEWEAAMESLTAYLEDECGGAFDDLEDNLEDLTSIPE